MPGVDELRREQRLIGLAAYERVFLTQAPAPIVALPSVRGDASLDQLAIRRFDVAEETVCAAHERSRVDLAGRGEQSPDAPLQAVVERGRLGRLRERIERRVRGVLGGWPVEVHRHDA